MLATTLDRFEPTADADAARDRDSVRKRLGGRAGAFVLVVIVHILLLFVLLLLTPDAPLHKETQSTVMTLLRISEPKPTPAKIKRTAGAPPRKSQAKVAPPAAKRPLPTAKTSPATKPFGTELFDAVDISKLPNHRAEIEAGQGTADAGQGNDSVSVAGPGEGPGGERLYQAEWVTEPTHAELAAYLTKGAPQDSWGIIACKTVEKFRVEDCQELAESPIGSGLARSLRQAAWQFKVRPPRVNGKSLIGAWVRIRVDFSQRPEGAN